MLLVNKFGISQLNTMHEHWTVFVYVIAILTILWLLMVNSFQGLPYIVESCCHWHATHHL